MDEQDLDLDFEDLDDDAEAEGDPERFYWALKAALVRTPVEPPAPAA